MKQLTRVFVVSLLFSFSSLSSALVLDISFDTGGPVTEFNLGTFDSPETGASFYAYGSPDAASANPVYPGTSDPIPLMADALQIFAHQNTGDGEISFGVILERANGSGGGAFSALVDWSAPATLAFVDDSNETGTLGAGGPQNLSLLWSDCCTDGFVISGFDPLDLFLSISEVSFTDLNQVVFLSPDRQFTSFDVSPDNPINISITPCDPAQDPDGCVINPDPEPNPVPEPSSLLLVGLGLLGLLTRRFSK